MFRLGIIGMGIIASAHTEAISKISDFELVAISEINEERAKIYSENLGVPCYTDYKEMCEKENLDAVIINLPHFLHCESAVFCLEKGIHVLCEKPMANTVAECDKMIAASEKSGAKLIIGHIQRFFQGIGVIKDYIDNGTLGKLVTISEVRNEYYFADNRPRWFLDKKLAGGGIIINHGAHGIDKILYTVGESITNVHGECGNFYREEFDVEGHANISFRANGIPCSISLCGYETFYSNQITYTFTHGALRSDNSGLHICDEKGGTFRKLELPEPEYGPFEYQLTEFAKAIRGEKSISPDGYYGRKVIETIEKVYAEN